MKSVDAALQIDSFDDYKLKGYLVYYYVGGNHLLLVPNSMESNRTFYYIRDERISMYFF